MNKEQVAALAKPFEEGEIGKLPRVTCKACSDEKRTKHCSEHRARVCDVCHAYVSERHIHLDYVGHAETTKRLLEVDPGWFWEPVAFDEEGHPLFDQFGGLWIRLTIAEVTRIGYGDAGGKTGPNAVKEAIGDAIRNAAMRFGVALDLWSKSDAFEFKPLEAPGTSEEDAAAVKAPQDDAASGASSSGTTSETGSSGAEALGVAASPTGQARLLPGEEPVSGTTPADASPQANPAEQAGGEGSVTVPDDPPAAAGDYEAPASEEQWDIAREHIGSVPTILGKYQLRYGTRKKKAEVTRLELAELIEDALKKAPAP